MIHIFLTIIFLASSPVTIRAQSFSGTGIEFGELCASSETSVRLACSSFIKGLITGLYLSRSLSSAGITYCLPDIFGVPQALLIIQKFMRDHPEMLHQDFGSLATTALVQAFPCGKAN